MKIIDFRSDTVTRPSAEMREAINSAKLGDDVFGDDPTVNELELLAAEMSGKEAAIFTSSGTQANLLALMGHCERGDEYIAGNYAHCYNHEGGGAAVLGGIQPQTLDSDQNGILDLKKVEKLIKPDDIHFAKTRLLCLENTFSGAVLPLDYLSEAVDFCHRKKLHTHLDGARVFNATVEQQVPLERITSQFDSVSFCLSKGLGAPSGSLLCSSRDFISKARRWRKMLGGGMRQVGILASAGIYALKNNIPRLVEDHNNAQKLAKGLAKIPQISIVLGGARTNMVFLSIDDVYSKSLTEFLRDRKILIFPGTEIRMVTHLDISSENIKTTIKAFEDFFSKHPQ